MKKILSLLIGLMLILSACAAQVPVAESDIPASAAPSVSSSKAASKSEVWEALLNQPPSEEDPIRPESVLEPSQAEEETQSVTVYVTETGEKYHREGCQYLRKSCIPIDLESARLSYEPCSKCHPPA